MMYNSESPGTTYVTHIDCKLDFKISYSEGLPSKLRTGNVALVV